MFIVEKNADFICYYVFQIYYFSGVSIKRFGLGVSQGMAFSVLNAN